jgi:phosphoglycerate kinase
MTVLKMADMALRGKRVLIREDLNVPIKHGQISDDTPIRAALPALQQALQAGARVIVMSHLGRPEEGVFSEENSLGPVARHLSGLLDREVPLTRDWLDGVDVESGELVLCENVRFNKGEKKNSDELAKRHGGAVRHLRDGSLRHCVSGGGIDSRSGPSSCHSPAPAATHGETGSAETRSRQPGAVRDRGPDFLHLHRRRRLSGISGGEAVAGGRSAAKAGQRRLTTGPAEVRRMQAVSEFR